MSQGTWPNRSDGHRIQSLSLSNIKQKISPENRELPRRSDSNFVKQLSKISTFTSSSTRRQARLCARLSSSPSSSNRDFSALPNDLLIKIMAPFTLLNIWAASLVCKSWCEALRPLKEAMLFLRWGKRFKHGRGGVRSNLAKALDSFLKGASRGSTLAMVDAGLVYWEMGEKKEAIALYHKAALLGDPACLCRMSYLQVEPPNPTGAVKWLQKASSVGHIRVQYQLGLCLHHGHGIDRNIQEASLNVWHFHARWYLRAAESGYARGMYNVSLCYSFGEGLVQSHQQSRKWMQRAADRGHYKAQFEHGLRLFAAGGMMKAVVYLELATCAGERAAGRVKNVILQHLSASLRDHAMHLVDNWKALPSSH